MQRNFKVKKPIFIIGCGRSGTTVLFNTMSKHPDLKMTEGYPDGEDHIGWIKHGDCILAGLGNPNIHKGHTGYHYCLHMDESHATPSAIKRMTAYYDTEVLGQTNDKRILNKCPHLSNKLRYVRAIFPDAKFIHIIRDCLPVVSSWIRIMEQQPHQVLYWPDTAYPCFWVFPAPTHQERSSFFKHEDRIFPGGGIHRLADYWATVNHNIPLQLSDTPDQLLTIKYEDFCKSPTDTLGRIFEFCEITSCTDMTEFTKVKIGVNNNKKYLKHLTKDTIEELMQRANTTRHLFGYS